MSQSPEHIEKSFDHLVAEGRIYKLWEAQDAFRADPDGPGEPFVIVIPPPNVTGSLHMGHALDVTLQDILVRYHRMMGFNTLWVPGTDHAGIATQAVVERYLEGQGTSRLKLGREAFLERVWQWKEEFGGRIIGQLKRLGASCDWSRERFTMDPGLSRAVREVFVSLYEEGLIYRGDYVVNWCPRCHTAISDIEVEHEERDDLLYHIRYDGVDGGRSLTVATTRPETLFGDVAVAINPSDPRYPKEGELRVRLPLTDRVIPLVRDPYVDLEFGTGALKVTPAHDINDFNIALRHGLPMVECIDKDGLLTEAAGPYRGLGVDEARVRVAQDLGAQGLLEKTEPLRHKVGVCYRCRTVIEPLLSLQWFVRTKGLAEAASGSVRDGRVAFVPKTWERTFFDWMGNIRDWCISRQLWWGHRIPAWYCHSCGKTIVSREDPDKCPDCGADAPERDPDVLDTWFSSALWPFSTLGFPEKTKELGRYYPTTVLVTGFDIIFFWVARMMMMGLKVMGDVPFRTVCLHPLVRDAQGRKMSKSKGNVIDPLSIIDRHGSDPFRFALASQAGSARDLKISDERVAGYSRFVNKLWNAARFTLSHLENLDPGSPASAPGLPGRWIRSRANGCAREVAEAISGFHFDRAADSVYHFIRDEFCDWFLELAKPLLYGEDKAQAQSARMDLLKVFGKTLALLHPVMPFVTEELWGKLPGAPGNGRLLMLSPFPVFEPSEHDPDAERDIGFLMDTVRAVRQARGDFGVPPGAKVSPVVATADPLAKGLIEAHAPLLLKLMGAQKLDVTDDPAAVKPGDAAEAILPWGKVWTPLSGQIDLKQEKARLDKEGDKLSKDIAAAEAKLSNQGYLSKAPADVVEETRDRLAAMRARLEGVRHSQGLVARVLGDMG
ncbi:MAG: valine--tRNA ligase [Deltaproteobacteria bacterium]|jgi:valyl-tRNA synthetase|nr:valine--tRNA ligase [Deltaproteobacteria bacterium]